MSQDTDGIMLLDASNISEIEAAFEGPNDTPYTSGRFKLRISIPNDYPFSPPKVTSTKKPYYVCTCTPNIKLLPLIQVRMITKVFHPNISSKGVVCLDRLADEW